MNEMAKDRRSLRACEKCIDILSTHWNAVGAIADEVQRDYAVHTMYFAADLKRQVWRGQLAPSTLKLSKYLQSLADNV